jgi:hypothetical protein
MIFAVVLFPNTSIQANNPSTVGWSGAEKYTREEFAHMTKTIYDKYRDEILKIESQYSKLLLIHIPIGVSDFQRRAIIRAYQINSYEEKYDITYRFMLGKPDAMYLDALKFENDTHGDLIVFNDFEDNREAARTTKSPHFYKYLESQMAIYRFVGRLDSDCFINFDRFWPKYFNHTIQIIDDFALVAAWCGQIMNFPLDPNDWPQGSFYIFSWKMLLMFNKFYENVPRELIYDDELIGRYIYDSNMNFTNVIINPKEVYEGIDVNVWKKRPDLEAVRVHELKTDEQYITVAVNLVNKPY